MSKINSMNQAKAERSVESICKWLANGAPGCDLTEEECFGTIQQDLAIGFAQEILASVLLPTRSLFKIALSLNPGTKKATDNTIIKFPLS